MKIEVDKIKREPLRLSEDIPAKEWDLDSSDIKFVKNIHVVCDFSRIDNEIIVSTHVVLTRRIACSRCLKEVEQKIKKDFELNYEAASFDDCLEVDKDIREELLIDFPMKVLCRPDCKGICAHCGVDLNDQECVCIEKKNGVVRQQKFKINVAGAPVSGKSKKKQKGQRA